MVLQFIQFFLVFTAVTLIISCSRKESRTTQLDKLERIFETGNWKMETAEGTGYMFFSREGDVYRVYSYNMKNGDSVGSRLSTMEFHKDTLVWNLNDIKHALTKLNDNSNTWSSPHAKELTFTKLDSHHIVLTTVHEIGDVGYPGYDTLTKTLPIGTFLVRSKYDYLHGTNTADSLTDSYK